MPLTVSYLGVVGRLLDDLRSHPERRSHKRFPLDLSVRQLTGHTEVCQLHLAVLRQEDIGSCGKGGGIFIVIAVFFLLIEIYFMCQLS